jgi:hypothetical protein
MIQDIDWAYMGAFILALIIIYGIRNYWVALFGGYVAFCVFYFRFDHKWQNFQWSFYSALQALKDAAIIYIISFAVAAVIYTLTNIAGKKYRVAGNKS